MSKRKKFPLVFGFLSLDLVNTEVIAYGRRRELLTREQDLLYWLHTMCKENSSLDKTILLFIIIYINTLLFPKLFQ